MSEFVLGTDIATSQSVRVPHDQRTRGTYIIGLNGTGKTTLIESMIVQDMQAGHGLCLLDPHGDLTDSVLARVPPEREADVILWDITDVDYPFGLNLYECQNSHDPKLRALLVDQVIQTFEKVWGTVSWGPRIEYVLRNTAQTLLANPGMTMVEIPKLLLDADFRAGLVANVRNPQTRHFWKRYERKKLPDQDEFTESTLNKLDGFLSQELLYHIVGQSKTAINFRKVMDAGKILLVRLDAQLENITKLIGSVIVGQILSAALSRADTRQRRPFFLYADEYPFFATPSFAHLIDQARKYNVATTIAHQRRDQLDAEHRKAPLGAANLVVFTVIGADAQELALTFKATPQPGEKVLRMKTVRAKLEVGTEEVWDPPQAEQFYKEVNQLLDRLWIELEFLADVFVRRRTWDSHRYVLLREEAKGILNRSVASLSEGFNPNLRQLKLTEAEIKAAITASNASKQIIQVENRSFGKEKKMVIDIPVLPTDENGRTPFSLLTERPSRMESFLLAKMEKGNDQEKEISGRLLSEIQPLLQPLKEHAVYWLQALKPYLGWRIGEQHVFLDYYGGSITTGDSAKKNTAIYFNSGHWEDTPFPEAVAWLKGNVERVLDAMAKNYQLKEELWACRAEHPIIEDLGYEVPLKDVSSTAPYEMSVNQYEWVDGPEEPIANARNRIADELAQLPQFHARVKLGSTEHLITTRKLPEVKWIQETEIKLRRIRRRSQDTYGKSVDKVIDEIEHRQERVGGIITESPANETNYIQPQAPADDDEEDYLTEERE